MDSENLPANRQTAPQVVLTKGSNTDVVNARSTALSRSIAISVAGQVVKLAVFAILDWLNNRRASEGNLVERGDKVQPDTRNNTQQFFSRDKSLFQLGKSGCRGLRRRKRRWW